MFELPSDNTPCRIDSFFPGVGLFQVNPYEPAFPALSVDQIVFHNAITTAVKQPDNTISAYREENWEMVFYYDTIDANDLHLKK
ncbi:hypothetical protein [Desulfopila inferna]|uniref:hypothetical protein n=1 Tax=Desulfopila inferna TaxID=468528 RepID=UPI0019641154|nr:hypothetical protein [Desulfopila inferna]MBM9603701.1 hypothetical protein [Desulfopila inferna]